MSYWDTSALLKLYVTESDSTEFRQLMLASDSNSTAFIGKHEARAVFRRREADGLIGVGEGKQCFVKLTQDITTGWIKLVAETDTLEVAYEKVLDRCLSQAPPLFVRTNDALHLAAAKVAGESDFISADNKQRLAAAFLGFNMLPPAYPIPTPLP